jgi:hypothetical protein
MMLPPRPPSQQPCLLCSSSSSRRSRRRRSRRQTRPIKPSSWDHRHPLLLLFLLQRLRRPRPLPLPRLPPIQRSSGSSTPCASRPTPPPMGERPICWTARGRTAFGGATSTRYRPPPRRASGRLTSLVQVRRARLRFVCKVLFCRGPSCSDAVAHHTRRTHKHKPCSRRRLIPPLSRDHKPPACGAGPGLAAPTPRPQGCGPRRPRLPRQAGQRGPARFRLLPGHGRLAGLPVEPQGDVVLHHAQHLGRGAQPGESHRQLINQMRRSNRIESDRIE